jgi:phage terminase large subunit
MYIERYMVRLFASNADLFTEHEAVAPTIKPWKPHALAHDQWPPDYRGVYAWRIQTLTALRADSELLASARIYYSSRPAEFIQHWMDTYNPRKGSTKWMPFVFFQRQNDFIQYLEELRHDGENGLVEKCRDIGATWLACAYSVWCWLFLDDDATGWGSRKQELVDKLGDPDSIFEKMRLLIKRLPDVWLPESFKTRDHATFMKLINPEHGATITGESGDNIGRGGRKARYFKDESAHYERPEKIEAALGDNTDVQIDISSVNGLGNVFHRRREAGIDWQPGVKIDPGFTRVFVFDWRDHPEKTQEWYDQRKAKAEREGMQHVFAQEVDRNYSAAVQNTIISYEWLQACIDAHLKVECLRQPPPNVWMAGLDVADEGLDRNALALRQWVILRHVEEWGERDPGMTARLAITGLRNQKRVPFGTKVQYDCIGVGSNVKSEYNRWLDEGLLQRGQLIFVPWNAGAAIANPYERIIPDDDQSPLNRDFFANMKAQAWWSMRARCYKTWRAVTHGDVYTPEELISFDSEMPLLHQLLKELAQPVSKPSASLKTMVDKKPEGTKSPNLADATIQAFFPAPDEGGYAIVGGYSG